MGQYADDLIDGLQCSWCSTYFVQEHGFPVICKKCYESYPDRARMLGIQKASFQTIHELRDEQASKQSK